MKLVLSLLGLVAIASSRTLDAQTLTGASLVDYVNSVQNLWLAKESKWTLKKMQSKVMNGKYIVPLEERAALIDTIQDDAIPDSFDARAQWPACLSIKNIRDQSDCGSCWAFGAAEAMSDRSCIATNGHLQVTISADDLLSCCGSTCGDGCEGGYPIQAWKWWVNQGVCTGGSYQSNSGCKPYPIAPCGHHANETYYGPCPKDEYNTPKCENSCQSGYPISYQNDKHFGKSAYAVAKSVTAIQKEIMTYGPVEAAYSVYEDFYQYTSGVYIHTAGQYLGGHAVKIIGWGVDKKTPYWLVANSWNSDWGENGFFRILRGVDECGIEDGIVAGIPK